MLKFNTYGGDFRFTLSIDFGLSLSQGVDEICRCLLKGGLDIGGKGELSLQIVIRILCGFIPQNSW